MIRTTVLCHTGGVSSPPAPLPETPPEQTILIFSAYISPWQVLLPSYKPMYERTQVYSCETGNVLLSHDVPSPPSAVAIVPTEDSRASVLLAVTDETVHRWYLPPLLAATGASGGGGSPFGSHDVVAAIGAIRAVAAFPAMISATMTTTTDDARRTALATPSASASPGVSLRLPDFSKASGLTGSSPKGRRKSLTQTTLMTAEVEDDEQGRRQLVLLAGERGLAAVDTERGGLVAEMAGHIGGVSHVAVAPDGRTFVSIGKVRRRGLRGKGRDGRIFIFVRFNYS